MKTSLVAITAATIAFGALSLAGSLAGSLVGSPAGAIPDPEPLYSPPDRVAVAFPFDAGSSPVQHVAGQDWLPARRVG